MYGNRKQLRLFRYERDGSYQFWDILCEKMLESFESSEYRRTTQGTAFR